MATIVASYPNAKDPSSPLDIRPVTGRIGAEVHGLALSGDLDAGTVQAIEAALVRHKVLFFRGQQHLDNAEHETLAGLFGDPVAHPAVPVGSSVDLYFANLSAAHIHHAVGLKGIPV